MENADLKKLVYKIAISQDKIAFSNLFDYFAPKIMGYLITSGSTKELAEEITQEVLSTIWQKSYQYKDSSANVSTWIFTIARNKRIDRLRKNENPSYNSEDLVNALYSAYEYKNDELEEKVIEMQAKLDDNEKKLIKMNFFEGKSHKNISSELEIPLGTVKSKIRTILKKMKE
ncbi:sigma-70 family RNA polymerase sigma factor [Alphaproteobacteria bacterium]|nr:sigma-70 family RNA polymerase sigma factor [Alphaproteobacteria bacterium]